MNWFQEHLNYSWILLSLIGTLLIALILNLFVDVVWQPGLFGGFAFAPSVVDKSDFLLVLEYPLNMVAPLTAGWWALRQKSRSLWWLLIIFVPFVGVIVFLCLKNRSQMEETKE